MDRRVACTWGILQNALNRLTLKSGYESVTIKDICDEATVGRSAFYAHFTGKNDLKWSGLQHLRHHLMARQQAAVAGDGAPQDRTLSFSLVILERARNHTALYMALIGDRGDSAALGFICDDFG